MTAGANPVVVSAGFDDLRSPHLRFLQEASRRGPVTVLLWPDEVLERETGRPPKFPLAERLYLLRAVRYVARAIPLAPGADPDTLPELASGQPQLWLDVESDANERRQAYCRGRGLEYHVLHPNQLSGFPVAETDPSAPGRKKVVVTGCYDWLHSGHVRFFEEVSSYGDLYVIVGHDANIRLLKGQGHPLFPEAERRYVAGSFKYVKQALVSSGNGWLDADPEIRRLKPDIYAVNEDGDRGGKREYCKEMGIEYLVLKRTPAPGLKTRTSTALRGF